MVIFLFYNYHFILGLLFPRATLRFFSLKLPILFSHFVIPPSPIFWENSSLGSKIFFRVHIMGPGFHLKLSFWAFFSHPPMFLLFFFFQNFSPQVENWPPMGVPHILGPLRCLFSPTRFGGV